jgi:Subtilase family
VGHLGYSYKSGYDSAASRKPILERFVNDARARNVILVLAAGNDGQGSERTTLGDLVPQSFGSENNDIITVGAVTFNGDLYPETTPQGGGLAQSGTGDITVYAQGYQVISWHAGRQTGIGTGTSLAAPIVVCYPATLFWFGISL